MNIIEFYTDEYVMNDIYRELHKYYMKKICISLYQNKIRALFTNEIELMLVSLRKKVDSGRDFKYNISYIFIDKTNDFDSDCIHLFTALGLKYLCIKYCSFTFRKRIMYGKMP
jgi:hypothetical protein